MLNGQEAALLEALGVEGTGRSVITEVCRTLRADLERWQDRDLSGYRLLYLFLDGIYLRLRPEDKGDRRGAVRPRDPLERSEGAVLHLVVIGDKESTAYWEAFLEDLKARGMNDPVLAVVDGNAGVRKALRHKFPQTLVQRCQVHRLRNVLAKLPEVARPLIKKLILKAFTAASFSKGLALGQAADRPVPGGLSRGDAVPGAGPGGVPDGAEVPLCPPDQDPHHQPAGAALRRGEAAYQDHPAVHLGIERHDAALRGPDRCLCGLATGCACRRISPRALQQLAEHPESEWEDPDLMKLAA